MNVKHKDWTIKHLKDHLQAAVDLEFWTIPFYMSAMYSVKDRSSQAYQMLRTVVNQEMLHLQCAANIANAYGLSPTMKAPVYQGTTIPHLDFSLDNPKAIAPYKPYTAEIGALDLKHINAMCLIEIPEYLDGEKNIQLQSKIEEYGSIGAFYQALRFGAYLLRDSIQGGVRQVDYFSAFYRNMPNMTITESGENGFDQIGLLIDLITDQGEGQTKKDPTIPSAFQNTADDTEPHDDHFAKFNQIKNNMGHQLPDVYIGKAHGDYTDTDKQLEVILIQQFSELRNLLEQLFKGDNPEKFFSIMASVGGAISNCWHHGVTPRYS
ncbi:ferritin-like domain-containing protein [Acaryochloris sp. IP29b_bin.148]|uniref:ferritin-like domain-containing protein n=1 Tax=Acaryochloris sp. IP29b_bin.148 TaxID=2969218 RepID=UPI00261C9926|nr:ferritin-like domain-containing protein [Acaryochloris sp. IP29b_bin.148]